MIYNKYTIETLTEAEDIIISTLYDIGIEGALVEDKVPLSEDEKARMFVDILPQIEEDDGIAYVSFFLDASEDNSQLLETVRGELNELRDFMDVGSLEITVSSTEDTDYLNNWKQYFHQFYVDDILITPSWEEVSESDKDKMIIHIDPGTAFGTDRKSVV